MLAGDHVSRQSYEARDSRNVGIWARELASRVNTWTHILINRTSRVLQLSSNLPKLTIKG